MSSLSIFHFDTIEVRAVTIDGNPWFVASDVCAALGHSNPSKAVSDHVDDDDKSNHSLGLPGKQPLVVNESGLYALIFGSQLESAKRFKKLVTSEVLPSIRSTGSYIAPQASAAPGIEQDLRVVGILADLLRVAPSGRITMAQVVLQQSAPHRSRQRWISSKSIKNHTSTTTQKTATHGRRKPSMMDCARHMA